MVVGKRREMSCEGTWEVYGQEKTMERGWFDFGGVGRATRWICLPLSAMRILRKSRDHVVSLAGVYDRGDANVHDAGNDDANEGVSDQAEQDDHVVDIRGIEIVANDEIQAIVADQPKKIRKKRKTTDGASGSGLPPKKLRSDHVASGDVSANVAGKSLAALQGLLDRSTLALEVGVTVAATVPFVTSSVTPTPEHEDGGGGDSATGPIVRTRPTPERFVVLTDSSHYSSTNAADDEVTSVVRSSVPPPVLTVAVTTTVIPGATSVPPYGLGVGQVNPSIFRDFASPSMAEADVAGPSQPTNLSAGSFYVSQDMDAETLRQVYIPKWNVINDSVLDDPNVCRVARQACFSAKLRMRLEHELRGRQKLEERYAQQVDRLKERDVEIAGLRAQLSLKEAEAAKAIRLRGQITTAEAAEATRITELNDLKEKNVSLEGKVVTLESAVARKDADVASSQFQIAKLIHELSNLQLSCDELSVKASSLESKKDKLVDHVSGLEVTCFTLCDKVLGYKLFKEQVEKMQDEQVRVLDERVASIDFDLMEMILHMDAEFYPRYLTTIARRRWILSRGLKLVLTKCLSSLEYLFAMGEAIGRAIDKGMEDGLAVGIEHGRVGRSIDDVAAFNPSAEGDYVAAINALRGVNFSLLAQLEANKDSSMADIMDLLRLQGPAAETSKAS
ncbi:hypothetical protein Tco_0666131 [Tanacetum coccineum]